MVSYFNTAITMALMLVFSLLHIAPGAFGRMNRLEELYKRDEMLQIAGYGEERLSTVLISGTVLCHTRSSKHQPSTEYVAGAKVRMSCHPRRKTSKLSNWVQVTTNVYGDYAIDLPSHLHAISNLEKRCTVRVVSIPNSSPCRPFFTRKQAASLKLSMEKDGIRTYTAQNIYLTQKPHKGKKLRTRKLENGAKRSKLGNRLRLQLF